MRRISGPERDEVTREWRKLHNEERNDLHTGERRCVYRVLMGKPEGKRPLGRPRRRLEDNIKMDLQEVRCGGVDWIELA